MQTILKMQGGLLMRVIGLVCLLGFVPAARAQSTIEVKASFNQAVCYLGDEITFEIAVTNSDSVEPPDLSGVPGAAFAFRGTSDESRTMVSIINGRRREEQTRRLVMRWTVTPNDLGTLVIPSMLVRVDSGQVVRTPEASIRVLEPERDTRDVVRVRTDSTVLYLNQPTRVTVSWLLTADIEFFSFRASKAEDGLEIRPEQRPRQGRDQRPRIEIFGGEAIGALGYDTLDGKRVRSLEFDLMVIPTKTGPLSLGPIVVSYDERVDRRSSRRMIASSKPIVFDVRTLPTKGRPATFDGLLGTHDIEVRADRDSVSVGDPILLEATIYGPEPMAGVRGGPDLSKIPGFTDKFRLSSDGWTFRQGSRQGERTFTTTVRVTDPDTTEIPAIPLAFFDPGEGEYRVAMSDPIPLTVRDVREITAADAVVSSALPSISREPLTATDAGVWAIDRGPGVLASADPMSDGWWKKPGLLAAVCAPPVLFALMAAMALRRRGSADEAARRRKRALKVARRALARGDAAEAVRGYLADVFGASRAAITGADGERLLRAAGIEDAGPVVELIAAQEASAYGRTQDGAAVKADRNRIGVLLSQIDRAIRESTARVDGEKSSEKETA